MATLKVRRVHGDQRQTVVVIESVDIRYEKRGDVLGLLARSEPIAVVISAANGAQAVDMNGKPVELDRLLDDVGELAALLER